MRAAVIRTVGGLPEVGEFADPVPGEREVLVEVSAAGLHPLVRMLAGGEHYGSDDMFPMIPGVDGTGRLPDGTRVYFGGVRSPYGTMAQLAAAPSGFCLPLPDCLDDTTAAAVVNPGTAAWLALTWRAALQPGETVLVLGATGVSGRIAVHLAGRLGAGHVIAAGRNPELLDRLGPLTTAGTAVDTPTAGAVVTPVQLGSGDDAAAIAAAAGDAGIDVIVDMLWGAPTEAAVTAVSRRGMRHHARRVRLVQVGQAAGPTVTLPAAPLRSSGLEITGTGFGTTPVEQIMAAVPDLLALAATGAVPIDVDVVPLAEVGTAWQQRAAGRRVVVRA